MIRSTDDEVGAVAITTALVLVVLILLAAFVVDLGATRADARTDQLIADSAVMAGALTEGDPIEQCEAAALFFAANIGAASFSPPSECGALAAALPCSNSPGAPTPPVSTDPIEIGDYSMVVTFPVPDDDPTMEVQVIQPSHDALQCDRIKVAVSRTRDFVFGPVAGGFGSGNSVNDAVAIRLRPGDPDTFASLIVLDTQGCNVLVANGSGRIRVLEGIPYDHDDDPATPPVPPEGVITVDSTATGTTDDGDNSNDCRNGNRYAIVGPGSGCLSAANHIYSYGHYLDPTNTRVYDSGDLDLPDPCDPLGPNGGMGPEPEPGNVIGRRQVDWRFNCLSDYPSATDPGAQRYPQDRHKGPGRHGACSDAGSRPPYIDNLHAALQTGDLTGEDFHEVTGPLCPDVQFNGTTLRLNGDPSTDTTLTEPRIWMNCDFPNGGGFTFDAVGLEYAVFNDSAVKPDLFRVHGEPDIGAVAYFRTGGIGTSSSGEVVDLQEVFAYIDSRSGGTTVDVTGGDLTWLAPELTDDIEAACAAYSGSGLPPPSCFAPLGLWSNNSDIHRLKGNGDIRVRGSFFVPNATQEIGGSGVVNYEESQFFASRLIVVGTADLDLIPNPNTNIPIDPPEPGLIR